MFSFFHFDYFYVTECNEAGNNYTSNRIVRYVLYSCAIVGNNWWAEKRVRENIQSGQIKLSLHYTRGTLSVMVCHARALPKVANVQEPNTYVKVYLKPDPTKATKRKTKVIKKNCHPSFMEMVK